MPTTTIRHSARIAPSGSHYLINSHSRRCLTTEDIYEIQAAKEKLDAIFSKMKSHHFPGIKRKSEPDYNEILRIRAPKAPSPMMSLAKDDRLQALRDEVLRMVSRSSPINGTTSYRGKLLDGDPVLFFKKNYAKYIEKGNEVIFSVDLLEIDKPLLTALRNSVPSGEMPLGNRAAKTDAIAAGRFSDGEASRYAANVAKLARLKRRE